MHQRIPSIEKIRAATGWEPTVDLDGILAEVIEHVGMARQGDVPSGQPPQPRNRPPAATGRRSQFQ